MEGIKIEFYKDNVTLTIYLKEDLTPQFPLFGHVEVHSGALIDESDFWDSLDWSISCNKEEFKKELKKSLEKKGYNWKDTYKDMKYLLNKAKKLNLTSE